MADKRPPKSKPRGDTRPAPRGTKPALRRSGKGPRSTERTHAGPRVPESRGAARPAPVVSAEEAGQSVESEDSSRMRLQKFLAMAGVDSRRNCEEYIRDGRVTINSEVVTDPARAVDPESDDVRLDTERLRLPRFRYFLINKPQGVLCTNSDPEGRPRAVDLIPVADQRMFTVGRLDETTEGLLLITNDGDLAQRLAHPKFEVIRKYRCQVAGLPAPEVLHQLKDGMYFAEGFFRFRSVRIRKRQGRSTILELELQEGKNREIRRLMARVGHKVISLERIAFGPLTLGSLKPGQFRELMPPELKALRHFIEHGESPREAKRGGSFGYRSGQTRNRRRRTAGASSSEGGKKTRSRTTNRGTRGAARTGQPKPTAENTRQRRK